MWESSVAANFNAPGQVVVSGERDAVARVSELATQAGARRVVELAVSGAFHSPLMASAAVEMESLLQAVPFARPCVPVLTNVSAEPVEDPEKLRLHLIHQITGPVRWSATVQRLAAMGINPCFRSRAGGCAKGAGAPHRAQARGRIGGYRGRNRRGTRSGIIWDSWTGKLRW